MVVRVHLVTTDTTSRADPNALWFMIKDKWPVVSSHEISYENHNFSDVPYLTDRFMVVQPSGEPENWSNQAEDFDDNASQYSIVSSIH